MDTCTFKNFNFTPFLICATHFSEPYHIFTFHLLLEEALITLWASSFSSSSSSLSFRKKILAELKLKNSNSNSCKQQKNFQSKEANLKKSWKVLHTFRSLLYGAFVRKKAVRVLKKRSKPQIVNFFQCRKSQNYRFALIL